MRNAVIIFIQKPLKRPCDSLHEWLLLALWRRRLLRRLRQRQKY